MKVYIESVSPVQKKINFEIPPDRVQEEIEKAYLTFQHSARIKGFRAGKVPRPLLERHFGEQVAAEVGSHLIEETYWKALQEHSLLVVSDPQFVTERLVAGQPFRYTATVEVRPEITIAKYEGLEVEKRTHKVADEEVDNALAHLAESFAQLHPVVDRDKVEEGDVVTLDYAASLGGRPLAGLQGKERMIEIGKEAVFPGFQEKLIGVKKLETVQFSLPLPERSDGEDLKSPAEERVAAFRVTVLDIARKEVPVLDDEFAKDHGECATLSDLKEKIRQDLQKAADQRADNQVQEALLSRLLEENEFDVPPSLVREQMRHMLTESGVIQPGTDFVDSEAALPAKIREEFAAYARKQVRSVFLLDALVTQIGIAIGDEELQEKIDEIVASVGMERKAQVEAFYQREENRRALLTRLLQNKSLQTVAEKALIKIVEKDIAGEREKE
ncbi:MAG: trigger factor [Candidatus Binatia bacterium]